jgi:hypothetical protein
MGMGGLERKAVTSARRRAPTDYFGRMILSEKPATFGIMLEESSE